MKPRVGERKAHVLDRHPTPTTVKLAAQMNPDGCRVRGRRQLPAVKLPQFAVSLNLQNAGRPREAQRGVKHTVNLRVVTGHKRDPVIEERLLRLQCRIDRAVEVSARRPGPFEFQRSRRRQREVGADGAASQAVP